MFFEGLMKIGTIGQRFLAAAKHTVLNQPVHKKFIRSAGKGAFVGTAVAARKFARNASSQFNERTGA